MSCSTWVKVDVSPVAILLIEMLYCRSYTEVSPVIPQSYLETEDRLPGTSHHDPSVLPDLLLGLHHVQDVPQVDTGLQLHRRVLCSGRQHLHAVVLGEAELLRERHADSQDTEQQQEKLYNHLGVREAEQCNNRSITVLNWHKHSVSTHLARCQHTECDKLFILYSDVKTPINIVHLILETGNPFHCDIVEHPLLSPHFM